VQLGAACVVTLLCAAASAQQQPPPAQPGQPPPAAAPPPGSPPPAAAPAQPPPGYAPPPGYGPPPGAYGPPPGAYGPPPQGGYGGYPYGYQYYYPPPPLPPRQLPYDEGQPVPPGYRVEERARKGLVIAGTVTFGSAYLLSILGAATAASDGGNEGEGFIPLFIPVAGPFITLGTMDDDASAATPLFILDGIAQVGGVALLIGGLAASETILLRNDVRADRRRPAVDPMPELRIGARAASARWRF
jgi:hypothetical protein